MKFLVYLITNSINGKTYVGVTGCGLETRFKRHCYDAMSRGSPAPLHAALRKYGQEAFAIETLHRVATFDDAKKIEIAEIAARGTFGRTGYNATLGGDGSSGVKQDPAWVAKRMAAHVGAVRSEETRRRISERAMGRPVTPERREELLKMATGRKFAPEVVAARAEKIRGHAVSQETRDKIAAKARGRRHSPEVIARVTANNTGANSKCAKNYLVTYEDGRQERIRGITAFCRERGLGEWSVRNTERRPGCFYKGLRVETID